MRLIAFSTTVRPRNAKIHVLYRPPDVRVSDYFFFSTKTYVVGALKNCLDETVLLSTQKTCLN